MDNQQQATYMAEKSLDYRSTGVSPIFFYRLILDSVFGFAAALLETFPVVGILFRCAILQTQLINFLTIFSVSNQVGAAMWAYGKLSTPHNHTGHLTQTNQISRNVKKDSAVAN